MKTSIVLTALMLAATFNLTYGQSSPPPSKVSFITEPGYDYGYLAWSKDWDSTTVYTVEVLQKNEDSNGEHFYRTVLGQEVRKNFLRLDKQFTSGSDLYYTVNAYDENRNLIATSDTIFANPYAMECECGPTLYETCRWNCNGMSYAWDLVFTQISLLVRAEFYKPNRV